MYFSLTILKQYDMVPECLKDFGFSIDANVECPVSGFNFFLITVAYNLLAFQHVANYTIIILQNLIDYFILLYLILVSNT